MVVTSPGNAWVITSSLWSCHLGAVPNLPVNLLSFTTFLTSCREDSGGVGAEVSTEGLLSESHRERSDILRTFILNTSSSKMSALVILCGVNNVCVQEDVSGGL